MKSNIKLTYPFPLNTKGFVNILLIVAMPVLLTVIFASLGFKFSQKAQADSKHICQVDLLKTQKSVVGALHTLLHIMNIRAYWLQTQVLITEIKIIVATASYNFPLAIELGVELKKLLEQQKILDEQQLKVIKIANAALKIGTILASAHTIATLAEYTKRNPRFFTLIPFPDKLQSTELAVEKVWNGTGAAYKLKDSFSDKQMISVRWGWTWFVHFPWESIDRKMQLFILKDGCAATLEEDRYTWIANLRKVKSLPSF